MMRRTTPSENQRDDAMNEAISTRLSLTRRRFLALGATAGVGAAMVDRLWADAVPGIRPGLGVVGLGDRGCRSLERISGTSGLRLVGLCDPSPSALRRVPGKELIRTARLGRLLADPEVDALVVAVPPTEVGSVIRAARVADKPVLLARPVPGLDELVSEVGPRIELVPGLHLSLGAASRSPSEPEATAVRLELVAGSMPELESTAIEALELAWSLLGGPRAGTKPTEMRAFGGPIGTGHSLHGSLRFEGEDGLARRLDLRFDHRSGSPLHGRLALGSASTENKRVAGLAPRRDGAPTSTELAALAAGLHAMEPRGAFIGLDPRNLVMIREWWRRLGAAAGVLHRTHS